MEDNMELKIKFVQTDLTDKGFLYKKMMQYGNIFNPSLIYENSNYISKLNFINSFIGGSISKHDRIRENDADDVVNADKSVSENYCELSGHFEENHFNRESEKNDVYKPDDYCICYNSENENTEDSDNDYDYDDSEDFEEYVDAEETENDEDNNRNELKVEFNTTGRLSVSKNQITITYDEGDLIGYDNAMVNIMMDSKNPDIITIQKDNFIKSTLTLEKNRKSISDYDSNFADVTIAVKTLEMMNNMTKKGGEINLLYTVETNGSPTEMVAYSLSAQRRLS